MLEGQISSALKSREAELERSHKERFDREISEIIASRETQIRKDAVSDYALERESKDTEINGLRNELTQLRGLGAQNEALKRELADAEDKVRLESKENIPSFTDAADQARASAAEEYNPQISQLQHQLSQTQKALQDAQRKAAQGSQQIQGEVAELTIEDELRDLFKDDRVVAVPKGVAGADCKLVVNGLRSNPAGSILIESKATKTFRGDYVEKLKSDLSDSDATSAVLVTQTLPSSAGGKKFMQDGPVTIVHKSVYTMAIALLRSELIKINRSNQRPSRNNGGAAIQPCYQR